MISRFIYRHSCTMISRFRNLIISYIPWTWLKCQVKIYETILDVPDFLLSTLMWNCCINSGESSPNFLTKSSFSLSDQCSNQLVNSFIWHWNIDGGLFLTDRVFMLSNKESTSGGTALFTRSARKSHFWYLPHVVNQCRTVFTSCSWTDKAITHCLLSWNFCSPGVAVMWRGSWWEFPWQSFVSNMVPEMINKNCTKFSLEYLQCAFRMRNAQWSKQRKAL